jgi:hypothetical protein
MSAVPEYKDIKHRYCVETESNNYPCDNYTIYRNQGVLCICEFPEYTDVFMIVGPVIAFHDFMPKMTLEEFEVAQKADIQKAIAMSKPTSPITNDPNCQ